MTFSKNGFLIHCISYIYKFTNTIFFIYFADFSGKNRQVGLRQNFAGKMNLARIKFLGKFICALCKVQSVSYEKLKTAFESDAKSASSLRRIQRFIAEYILDCDLIARLIFKMLPHQPPYRLAMDRTNWKFGETNINVLTLAIVYDGVAFPILISMLDKRGNSHTQERIAIIERYIRLFGYETIDALLADREFVGEKWIQYLNQRKIKYHIRNGPTGSSIGYFKSAQPFKSESGWVKGTLREGGIREPMIVSWEGKIKPGTQSNHICAAWDVMATVCDMANIKAPENCDGLSFLPELLGKKQTAHEYLYWEYPTGNGSKAIRMGKWKGYIQNIRKEGEANMLLYDLETDIQEQNNVAADHPDIIKTMRENMAKAHVDPVLDKYAL